MKMIIAGKKMDISEELREKIEKKLGKISKFFPEDTPCHVTLKNERSKKIMEVTISHNSMLFRAEEASADVKTALDKIVAMLERQIRKNKTRLEKKLRAGAFQVSGLEGELSQEEEREFNVVKVKNVQVKPMSVEEAILQMNLLGHAFFLFLNAQTLNIDLVYRRKDGNYGLMNTQG